MSHMIGKSAFKSLEERLNQFPQGAPPSETLYKILAALYSEKEAALVAQLPIRPFTIKTAARIWKTDEKSAHKTLDNLASRALLLDSEENGVKKYTMPPPMTGFFEFAFMRVREDIDQKLLSELFHQYINVEEDFIKDLFLGTETRFGRALVQEEMLSPENELHILDYERASHIIENATHIGVSSCYCRHKAHHLGKDCYAPMEVCLTFNNTADSLIRHGHARRVDVSESMEILHMSYENNLVQCGENVRRDLTFMCNCCGCCCEGMSAAREFGILHPIQTTGFLPKVNHDTCIKCGKCAKACPIKAIELVSEDSNEDRRQKRVKISEEVCLGCGVCVRSCPNKSLFLEKREEQIITPVNLVHRVVLQAIEKGQLQNLVFDKQAFGSHRAMAAVLSVIFKLPPLKQAMASKQLKSVYLDRLLSRF